MNSPVFIFLFGIGLFLLVFNTLFFVTGMITIRDIGEEAGLVEGDSLSAEEREFTEIEEAKLVLAEETAVIDSLRETLDAREKSVGAREAEVQRRTEQLEKLEERIETTLAEFEDTDFRRLAKVYTSMKPQYAAMILDTLDMELAVKLLASVQARQSAKILSRLSPSRAAEFSARIAMSRERKNIKAEFNKLGG